MSEAAISAKLKITLITLFPELIESFSRAGVFSQALKKNLLELEMINPRKFAEGVHLTVDDRPFGGGDGMIMLGEPLIKCMQALGIAEKSSRAAKDGLAVIYLSPQGQILGDPLAREYSEKRHLVLICGRYGGIDQRFLNAYVDAEISIGDYVLSGGELAACVLMEVVSRFVPMVLGHAESANLDSFATEGLLEHPNYTRPRALLDQLVPEILLGGHHQKIQHWKKMASRLVTMKKRPDLLQLSQAERTDLNIFWQSLSLEEQKSLGLEDFELEGKT